MTTLEPVTKIRFSCGVCGAPFAVAPELAGRKAVCKRCRSPLVVPDALEQAAPASPADPPQPSVSVKPVSGGRMRRRGLALVLIAVAGLGSAGILLGIHVKARQTNAALARGVAQNQAVVAELSPEVPAEWETAAVRTAALIAELEGLDPERGGVPLAVMLEFLRRQEEFMRAKLKMDQLRAGAQAALDHYRRHLWHPPGVPQQWPLYLEEAEALRGGVLARRRLLQEAGAELADRYAELVRAEGKAAVGLSAAKLSMETPFGDSSERLQPIWTHAVDPPAEAASLPPGETADK